MHRKFGWAWTSLLNWKNDATQGFSNMWRSSVIAQLSAKVYMNEYEWCVSLVLAEHQSVLDDDISRAFLQPISSTQGVCGEYSFFWQLYTCRHMMCVGRVYLPHKPSQAVGLSVGIGRSANTLGSTTIENYPKKVFDVSVLETTGRETECEKCCKLIACLIRAFV